MGYRFIMSCEILRSTQYIISTPHSEFYFSVVIFLKLIKTKIVDDHT